MRQFDYSVLNQPVTLKEMWREAINDKYNRLILLGMGIPALAFCLGMLSMGNFGEMAFGLLFVGGIGIFVVPSWKERVVLKRFTKANNLIYVGSDYPTELPGTIFGVGDERCFMGGCASSDEKWLIANYSYTKGSGKNRTTVTFGVVRLKLPRKLPHILLDSKKNNFFILTNLPGNFTSDQKLQLEGDFNNYFTVYAPLNYQRDALYILTPELMAILVEKGEEYDFEVVDDNLFIYTSIQLNFGRKNMQKTVERMTAIAEQIGGEFSDNVRLYADSRVENSRHLNVVGAEGVRLRGGISWGSTAIAVVVVAVFILIVAASLRA